MPIQEVAEAALYSGIHASVTAAAQTTRKVVSTGLEVMATPTQMAVEGGTALLITLTANALFWIGKKTLQAGWLLLSTTTSATTTAASNTYSLLFPPRPLAIKWHEEEKKEEPLSPTSLHNVD